MSNCDVIGQYLSTLPERERSAFLRLPRTEQLRKASIFVAKNSRSTTSNTLVTSGTPSYPATFAGEVRNIERHINRGARGLYDTAENIQIMIDRAREGSLYHPQTRNYLIHILEEKLAQFPPEEIARATNMDRRIALAEGRRNNTQRMQLIRAEFNRLSDALTHGLNSSGWITHLGAGINTEWLGNINTREEAFSQYEIIQERIMELNKVQYKLTTEEFNRKANELLGGFFNIDQIIQNFEAGEATASNLGKAYVIGGVAIALTGGAAAGALAVGGGAAAGTGAITLGGVAQGAATGAIAGAAIGAGGSVTCDVADALTNNNDNSDDFSSENLTRMATSAGEMALYGAAGGAVGGALTTTLAGTTLSTGTRMATDAVGNMMFGVALDAATGGLTVEGSTLNVTTSILGGIAGSRGARINVSRRSTLDPVHPRSNPGKTPAMYRLTSDHQTGLSNLREAWELDDFNSLRNRYPSLRELSDDELRALVLNDEHAATYYNYHDAYKVQNENGRTIKGYSITNEYWSQSHLCDTNAQCAWKMHLFSDSTSDFRAMAEVVIPYLNERGIAHKTVSPICSPELLAAIKPAQAGKAFTIYPQSPQEMAQIARELDSLMREHNLTRNDSSITGDAKLGNTGRLFYRYALISGEFRDRIYPPDEIARMPYNGNRGTGENAHLARDMGLEDDPWHNFNPADPNSRPSFDEVANSPSGNSEPAISSYKGVNGEQLYHHPQLVSDVTNPSNVSTMTRTREGDSTTISGNKIVELKIGDTHISLNVNNLINSMTDGEMVVIGRGSTADNYPNARMNQIHPLNTSISRNHILIKRRGNEIIITDISTFGSYIKVFDQ